MSIALALIIGETGSSSGTVATAERALTGVATALHLTRDVAPPAVESTGHVEARTFWSASLSRTMPYRVYLPPGYARGERRYPVVYLLHGMGGTDRQWQDVGVASSDYQMLNGPRVLARTLRR
jgi:predicted peptidase